MILSYELILRIQTLAGPLGTRFDIHIPKAVLSYGLKNVGVQIHLFYIVDSHNTKIDMM